MHSSNMQGERGAAATGYGPGGPSRPSSPGSGRQIWATPASAPSAASAASAARIAARSCALGSGTISIRTEKRLRTRAAVADPKWVRTAAPLLVSSLALVLAGAAAGGTKTPASWAATQIADVTSAGLMGADDTAFRPDDPLTAGDLETLALALQARAWLPGSPVGQPSPPTAAAATTPAAATIPTSTTVTTTTATTTTAPTSTTPGTTTTTTPTVTATVPTTNSTTTAPATTTSPPPLANPDRLVTMAQLDARLVKALGLGRAAHEFAQGARAAGLRVPSRFGAEVVARLLGLRLNHPAPDDGLELRPNDQATRAEAAYTADQILNFSGWEVAGIQGLADTFTLPALTPWQTEILDTAFSKIGMPYIWGGTRDGAETEFGVSSRGGYDCSGFVWRVYKLQAYRDEGVLAATLRGRTTYQMSGEVPRAARIGLADLQPADVIFFGDRGPRSRPGQVGHMGIYVGNGWFIHSSDRGVALAQLGGWYAKEFAWGRRPLAEAELEPQS
jgi:cell wall-associated NlpC family hydrolase